jgi:hypothetical protein
MHGEFQNPAQRHPTYSFPINESARFGAIFSLASARRKCWVSPHRAVPLERLKTSIKPAKTAMPKSTTDCKSEHEDQDVSVLRLR